MNLQNALALNSTPINTSVTVGRKSPHFQLVVKDAKTSITLSDEFMKWADIQNNKLNVYFEQGDNEVYFIFHQGNGEQGKSLAIDFFKGKRLPMLNSDGSLALDKDNKKVMSNEIGKKNNLFLDAKTISGYTVRELLCVQHPDITELEKLTGTFNPYTKEESEFSTQQITSVWTLTVKEAIQKITPLEEDDTSITITLTESPISDTIHPDYTLTGEVISLIMPSSSNEQLPEPVQEFVFEKLYTEPNTTAEAISNFENASTVTSESVLSEELELETV